MVEEAVKSYRVAYERDESGWWVATVRGVRGCHTQGRTVDEARRRIREALELFVDDARRARIVDDVKLPSVRAAAARAGIDKLAPTTSDARVPVSAISRVANWTRFSSCSGTSRFRRQSATSDASRGSEL